MDGRGGVGRVASLKLLVCLDEEGWMAAGCGVDLHQVQIGAGAGAGAEEVDVVVIAGVRLLQPFNDQAGDLCAEPVEDLVQRPAGTVGGRPGPAS